MFHNLKEGALFVADAHYPNHKKEDFLALLRSICDKRLQTEQLILMGDIFDLLVGNSPYLKRRFQEEIALIETIAKEVEVLYLEGNHDFFLKPLFSQNVTIVPLQKQPVVLHTKEKSYALAHGDKYEMSLGYRLYTKLIRSPLLLKLLPDAIAVKKLRDMRTKKICKGLQNFKELAKKIRKNYTTDFIIEGHYHMGVVEENYISLPSFACSGKIACFKDSKIDFFYLESKKLLA